MRAEFGQDKESQTKIFAMKPGKREFLGKENVVERKEYNIS